MPLRREADICDREQMVGVTFVMVDDHDLSKRIICRVTYEALRDRARMDGDGDEEWLKAWQNHLHTIEDLARVNYTAGKPLVNDQLLIDTLELTPLSPDKPTRWS